MGVQSNIRRRKFNGPSGRHSFKAKKRYIKSQKNIAERVDKIRNLRRKPYKIVGHISMNNGQPCIKYILKRITPFRSKYTKLHSVANSVDDKLKLHVHSCEDELEGYRLLNLNLLQSYIKEITHHVALCQAAINKCHDDNLSSITMNTEKNRCGLASEFVSFCSCSKRFSLKSSTQIEMSDGTKQHDVNVRAVWGTMATGGGVSSLNETFATLNVPGLSQPTFSSIEHQKGNFWGNCLQEDILSAGAEERKLAIERGDFHGGVPAITVICDGGWSKRSHKHTYNALGGVAVIFGAATGRVLHIGVRNKLCYICTLAETRQEEPSHHICFKNWNESSQAMEADVIVDGFSKAESVHGLRYMRVVTDGDSSVYAKIQELVPVWGKHVQKLESANHCCKCLRSSLEKLVEEKKEYKGKGGLRVRLVTAVRCAIRMRSKESNKTPAAKQLNHDIRNSIHHIFGDHSNCSNFCKSSNGTSNNILNSDSNSMNNSEVINGDSNSVNEVIKNQESFWMEGTCENDMEESRVAYAGPSSIHSDLLRDISILLDRVACKSSRLLGNFTTNLAESWMAIRSKFDGGKTHNRCNRGSWHARCYGGALRKNFGPAWSPIIWHKVTGTKPGISYISLYRRRSTQLLHSIKSKNNDDVKMRKRKRKSKCSKQSNSKKAKREYAEESLEVIEDVSQDELSMKCQEYLKTHVQLTDEQCRKTEELTKQQSLCAIWKEERRKRLTASTFGEIFHRIPKLPVKKLIHRLLYSTFHGTKYTNFGLQSESNTILEYQQKKLDENEEVVVQKAGLVIDLENKHLGASTDGIVVIKKDGSKGLIEIKNVLQKNKLSFLEACNKVKGFCLENISGSLHLKKTHNYYFQCQGQMNILKMPWIDFVVRRINPYQIFVERIVRDENLWNSCILPKLTAFYMKALLPELALPREHTSTGIREPELPWFQPETDLSKCKRKQTVTGKKQKRPQRNKECKGANVNVDQITKSRTRRRNICIKFVGRKILHEWCVDETTGRTEWYKGRVLDIISGKDGHPDTKYEVLYDGENEPH